MYRKHQYFNNNRHVSYTNTGVAGAGIDNLNTPSTEITNQLFKPNMILLQY